MTLGFMRRSWAFVFPAMVLFACAPPSRPEGEPVTTFRLTSPSFPNGGEIPAKYTCDGADVSPGLAWSEAPSGTHAFALIAEDPDAPAGTWTHWVLYDLPASASKLAEDLPKSAEIAGGGSQGRNDFRRIGYGGPCPPPGPPHRYFFKLNALDAPTRLKAGVSRSELERAMAGHILARAEWMGRYGR